MKDRLLADAATMTAIRTGSQGVVTIIDCLKLKRERKAKERIGGNMNENENPQNSNGANAESPVPTPEPSQVPLNGGTPVPPAGGAPVPPAGGAPIPPPTYQVPPQQQYAQPQVNNKTRTQGFGSARKEKWPAVVLAFTLGSLGIHKFYLGYKTEGMVMLLISIIGGICLFGLGIAVMAIFSYIEAAKYVSLTEEDFQATYVRGYKGWF